MEILFYPFSSIDFQSTTSILLDASFLLSLVYDDDIKHSECIEVFRILLNNQCKLLVTNIISAEVLNQEDKNKETEDKKSTDEDKKNTSMEEVKEGYYTVKSNDTLYSIARTYMPNFDPSETVAQILTRNNMNKDDIISSGQKLIISYETSLVTGENTSEEKGGETAAANATSHTDHSKYVVKSGDTLFSIAKEYLPDMDIMKGIELIKAHNNISVDTIKVEDTLCIPNK